MELTTWVGQKTVCAFGYTMKFRWAQAELEVYLNLVVLSGWATTDREPDVIFGLWRDQSGILLQRAQEPPQRLWSGQPGQEFKREVHMQLATFCPDFLFVHAGVVLSPFGLIVLPGRSWTGKSTLVRALVEAGCRYYSDEFAVISASGLVSPFPRPLCMRQGPLPDRYTAAQNLGWTPDLPALRATALVCTNYSAQTNRSDFAVSSEGEAVLELINNTVAAQIFPAKVLDYLPKLAQGALCLKGSRGEARQAADRLLDQLRSHRGSGQ